MSTLLGFLALIWWTTTVALVRSLAEQLGPLTAGACIYLLGGALGAAAVMTRAASRRALAELPRKYLLTGAGLIAIYVVCLQVALGWAANRQQVVEVGLVNYFWPGLTLALSGPLLGKRVRGAMLLAGMLVALAGVAMVSAANASFSAWQLLANLRADPLPYGLALVAAAAWATYSNLTRRWTRDARGQAMPLFFLFSGVVLAVLGTFASERPHWRTQAVLELLYVAIFPTLLAYSFWDVAMRRGRMELLVSASYLTPLASSVVTCLWLAVPMGGVIWAGGAMVVAGAVVCRYSVRGQRDLSKETVDEHV